MSATRILVFLSIITSLTGGLHYYIWARLVRDPDLPAPLFRASTLGLVALAFGMVATMFAVRLLPREAVSIPSWISFTWMGVMFFLVVCLAASDGVRLAAKAFSDPPADIERRQALARLFAGIVATAATGMSAAALASGLSKVAVKQVRVPLAKLPKALDGYRIVQLSDIHVGPTIGHAFIADLVARTNALSPDLIVITGDLVDGSVTQLERHVEPLSRLRAKHGVFFVTGNHEYYSDALAWIAHIEKLGIRVLRNERVAIGGESGFDLAGVDDATAHQFDVGHGMNVARATEGRDPARMLILLAHQPKAIFDAARDGVDLQLSGHTHGGQLFPFNMLVPLQQPYTAGLSDHGATKIYVSRGTGYWGPPMRLGAPAEITELTLLMA
jgi:uncharacterized protein